MVQILSSSLTIVYYNGYETFALFGALATFDNGKCYWVKLM